MSNAAANSIKPEDAPKVRKLITEVLTTFNGYCDELGEPFLTMFKDLKAQYNSILEKLPLTDAVPAANEANWGLGNFLYCLTSTQALLNQMGSKLSELKARNSAAPAEDVINAAAEKLITARITEGKLVPSEKVTTLCSDAKSQGITEGESRVREELKQKEAAAKVIGTRKAALTTNSLPLPATDDLLGGTDEEFAAKKAAAEARVATLKGKGVALNSPLMADVWGTDAEFAMVERVVSSYASATPGGGNPFVTAPAAGAPGEEMKPRTFAL